jgi:hypothetical protein
VGKAFKMYVATQECAIGVVLLQEVGRKEFLTSYISRQLVDYETRYAFIKKMCLALYFTCTKFSHYILSSTCTIACPYDVVQHMLHNPILSGRLGKWAYTLVEYDLVYEPLRSMKGQIVADFMVGHVLATDNDIHLVEEGSWRLY